jgi:hypothetical protein
LVLLLLLLLLSRSTPKILLAVVEFILRLGKPAFCLWHSTFLMAEQQLRCYCAIADLLRLLLLLLLLSLSALEILLAVVGAILQLGKPA